MENAALVAGVFGLASSAIAALVAWQAHRAQRTAAENEFALSLTSLKMDYFERINAALAADNERLTEELRVERAVASSFLERCEQLEAELGRHQERP